MADIQTDEITEKVYIGRKGIAGCVLIDTIVLRRRLVTCKLWQLQRRAVLGVVSTRMAVINPDVPRRPLGTSVVSGVAFIITATIVSDRVERLRIHGRWIHHEVVVCAITEIR